MKVKTSVMLSEDIVEALEQRADTFEGRSELIERAIRSFLAQAIRDEQNARDLRIINEHADALNEEAGDVLAYSLTESTPGRRPPHLRSNR